MKIDKERTIYQLAHLETMMASYFAKVGGEEYRVNVMFMPPVFDSDWSEMESFAHDKLSEMIKDKEIGGTRRVIWRRVV